MSTVNPKSALYAQFAIVAKALAHEHRLELIELVAQGERSVDALADACGLSIANTSQHLQHMRKAGLMTARRDGKFVLYSLADTSVLAACAALRHVAEQNLAEVDRIVRSYFLTRDALEAVSRPELSRRIKKGLVTVLDVRPEDEFCQGHLPGAVNVPLGKLKRWLGRLDQRTEIVAYCRGPYCILSFEAVAQLRASGFSARRLEDGYPEWKADGLPVEASSQRSLSDSRAVRNSAGAGRA